jgi:MazG family protein
VIDALLAEVERRHGIRPGDGIQVLSAGALLRRPFDPGWPVLVVSDAAAQDATSRWAPTVTERTDAEAPAFRPPLLPGRHARPADPLALLRALYPADHTALGLAGAVDSTVGELTGEGLRSASWLLPALADERNVASPHALPWLAARLRAPDGCPWDRQQDHRTLQKFLLEEAYEVHDALEAGSTPQLAEELGDLLLQVVLHAQYAAEAGVFDLSDVYRSIMAKIVHRHPHVFGEVEVESVDEVLRNWERIKAGERAERGAEAVAPSADGTAAAFVGLSRTLPALLHAQEMQERAASLGYDWPDVEGVIEKVGEEASELLAAEGADERRDEFGDLLLVIVNLGRKLGVDAESALRAASGKFGRRFARVERYAAEEGRSLQEMTFEELDELWDRAKREEPMPAGVSAETGA